MARLLRVARARVGEADRAAYLAALQCGLIDDLQQASGLWQCDAVFEPRMSGDQRDALLAGWSAAVSRVRDGR